MPDIDDLRALAKAIGTKAAAEAYGRPLRTVQRVIKDGAKSKAAKAWVAEGIVQETNKRGKPYRERTGSREANPAPVPAPAPEVTGQSIRRTIEAQKLAAGEQGAYVVGGVLAITETTLKASGVQYRPIRTATFADLAQAVENAQETVIRGNEGVPYAIVLGKNGRYFGVILGSNTALGSIYDDEDYQALLEYAESGEVPSGWEDLDETTAKKSKSIRRSMKAVILKITEGEEYAELWSAPRVWSTIREGLRLVPVDQAIEEFTKEVAKVLGENVRIETIETGSAKTRTIVATL